VWVYSIRRKFAHDIDEVVGANETSTLKEAYGVKDQECTVEGQS
jgi:hypothetical protein